MKKKADNVVTLEIDEVEHNEEAPQEVKKEAPAQAVRDFDEYVQDVRDLAEMTGTRGWKLFYGDMLSSRTEAKEGLLTAEKMNDVIRCQSTVMLVNRQIERLQTPVERLNELHDKFPLFRDEFRFKGHMDEVTGRVTLTESNECIDPPANQAVAPDDSEQSDLGKDNTNEDPFGD